MAMTLALVCSFACKKQDPEIVTVTKEVPVEPITAYSYDGTSYTVHTVTCTQDDDFLEILVAREPEAPFSSYVFIGIPNENIGRKMDFSDKSLVKRLDYFLAFEDPSHYYSADYAPKSGTLLIEKSSNGTEFKLTLDAKLYDGKPLKVTVSGVKVSK